MLAAVVATLRHAARLDQAVGASGRDAGDEAWSPPGEDAMQGALAKLIPALEPAGPLAAPAVPALRIVLSRSMGEEAGSSRGAEGAVRVLGAIGPAAKDAVPDLRRWAASNGDPNGLARAALTKIGASDR